MHYITVNMFKKMNNLNVKKMKEKIAELIKERNNRIDSIYTEIDTI